MASTLAELVQSLVDAFPRQAVGPATLRQYLEDLTDLPAAAVETAIIACRRTSTFFPTIAEIRSAAAEFALELPTEEEALRLAEERAFHQLEATPCKPCKETGLIDGEICAACRGEGKTFVPPPPLPELVAQAFKLAGGHFGFREASEMSIVRGQFARHYRNLRAAAVRSAVVHGLPAMLPAGRETAELEPASAP